MTDRNHPMHWTEYFRIVSPFLLLVVTAIGGSINSKLSDIDSKLFRHLTNDEIHTPKSIVMTRAEYGIYNDAQEKCISRVYEELRAIREKLDK